LSDPLECAALGRHYEVVASLLPILPFPIVTLVAFVMEARFHNRPIISPFKRVTADAQKLHESSLQKLTDK
jgi:hypothetical protein